MIRIRNWRKFQHYKHRNPPWIRLYTDIISDPENNARWHLTSADAAKFLVELWLLASRTLDGCLQCASDTLAFRLHRGDAEVAKYLEELELRGWIELDASAVLAERKHNASTETETETEIYSPPAEPVDDGFDEFWSLYPRKDAKKKARTMWGNLSKKKREAVMGDLPKYKDLVKGKEKQFILLPTTYLNQERWEDERESQQPQSHPTDDIPSEDYRAFLFGTGRHPTSKEEVDLWKSKVEPGKDEVPF